MQGKKNYKEKLFTSFQLSERVPKDNFFRHLKDLLDMQWLYKATASYYGREGNPGIDPVVFFKLILIGYLENQPSDRRIISTVSMRLDMLYFIGYDIDEPLPWHSTLSRTRQLYGEEIFKQLFGEVLKQCIDKGMVAGRRQAIDSVHVKANASMDSLLEKGILEDGAAYAASLKEEQQEENHDEPPYPTVNGQKKKKVERIHRWQQKVYKGKPGGRVKTEEHNGPQVEQYRSKYLSNYTHYSKTDPDAKIATKTGKPRQLNYLAQVSVDTGSHIITNIEAHGADKKDSQCVAEVVAHTVNNLKQEGLLVEEILADAGYSSGEALRYLENSQLTGYIPNIGSYIPHREGFTYDKENNQYICSQGARLVYKITYPDGDGYYKRQYRSRRSDCLQCAIREQCIGKGKTKQITDSVDKHLYDRMHERLQTTKARRMKKLRHSTVEPVIGTLVTYLGMKRVNTRGIKQANKCMLMAAIAYNLKKLLKFRTPKVNAAIKTMQKMHSITLKWLFYTLSVNWRDYSAGMKLIVQPEMINFRSHHGSNRRF